MAVSYQQLGIIAQLQGDQSEALHRYRQAMAIFEDSATATEWRPP